MKKNRLLIGIIVATVSLSSCNTAENNDVKKDAKENISKNPKDNELSVENIDKTRKRIESLQIKPFELSTKNLKEKIKQKWSKIHFYIENDVVVKVKTYPHPSISKRTEEFYANKDGLLLVVIEDNGEGKKGKENYEFDKMYYFNNNKKIKEINKEEKSEYTIRDSDAEELLSEFNEYLDVYQSTKK